MTYQYVSKIDSSQRRKIYEYCFVNITFLFFNIISLVTSIIPYFENTNLSYSISIALIFAYSILMACLHWPYDSNDVVYNAPDDENAGQQIQDFLSDEDVFPNEIKAESDDSPLEDIEEEDRS